MASAVIGALRVNLGIDTAQFTEGLKGVRASMANVGKQMQNWGGKLSTFISAPLALAGGAVATAAAQMAKDIDGLRKSAQISNVGFEEFQRLAYAARSVGIEGDKLSDIFKDVNDRVGDFNATGAGPMADFFENIAPKVGITAAAFKDLSGPEALQLYYDSLKKAGASQQEMTFYLEAMASDATALIPLLEQGGEGFRKLGEGASIISEGQAEGLKAYNDAMLALGEAVKGLTIALATSGILEFVTGLVTGLAELVQWLAQTNPEILKWGTVIAGLAAIVGPLVATIGLFVTAIAAISAPVLAVVAGVTALTAILVAFWPEIKAAWEWVTKLFDVFVRLHGEAITALIAKFQELGASIRSSIGTIVQEIVESFIDLHMKMFEIGGQIIEGLWQGIKAKWESVKAGIAGIGDSISDTVRSALGIHSPSRVMHEIGTYIVQGLANGMDAKKGEAAAAAVGVSSAVTDAFDGVDQIGKTISGSLSSAFQGLIDGSKSVKDVLSDLLNQFAKMWMDKAFQAIFSGGSVGGSGGGGGIISAILGDIGKLFGFARGGTILPGGGGGIDSQLVAFRKSPNERVDITKPGQSLGGGRADVVVTIKDGVLQGYVEQTSARVAVQVVNATSPSLVDRSTAAAGNALATGKFDPGMAKYGVGRQARSR